MAEEIDPMDELLAFLSSWGTRNEFKFILPQDSEKVIDFVNINLKTNTIFVDGLNVIEEEYI